jgi:hypothetical protein
MLVKLQEWVRHKANDLAASDRHEAAIDILFAVFAHKGKPDAAATYATVALAFIYAGGELEFDGYHVEAVVL